MIDATFWLGSDGVPLLTFERDDGKERTFYLSPHINGDVHFWLVGHRVSRTLWRNPEIYGTT